MIDEHDNFTMDAFVDPEPVPLPHRPGYVEFFVPGKPVAKQRARVTNRAGFARAYTPKETVNYESMVAFYASRAMMGREAFQKPVCLTIEVRVLPSKSMSLKRRSEALNGSVAPTKKPDLSNILKSIEDGMNKVTYEDDSQIVSIMATKVYDAIEGVRVQVIELDKKSA